VRAFILACIAAITIAVIGALVLGGMQESADQAFRLWLFDFSSSIVRFWPKADIPNYTAHVCF
jgi:hypothetical protein